MAVHVLGSDRELFLPQWCYIPQLQGEQMSNKLPVSPIYPDYDLQSLLMDPGLEVVVY